MCAVNKVNLVRTREEREGIVALSTVVVVSLGLEDRKVSCSYESRQLSEDIRRNRQASLLSSVLDLPCTAS